MHGSDGMDELTTTGPSTVAELRKGEVSVFEVTPEDAGLARAKPEDLAGGTPDENAAAHDRSARWRGRCLSRYCFAQCGRRADGVQ